MLLIPAPGVQVKLVAPVAVKFKLPPSQIVPLFTEIVGIEFTTIVPVAFTLPQPPVNGML